MPAQFEYYVVNAPLGLNWSDVTGDPKPKNETVLKLRKASWMWFSGRKRRRRNARETTQRGTDPVCLATDRRGQEGQRSLSGDAGLGLHELRELRQLREENRKLKGIVADLTLDKHILQEVLSKKA